MLMKKLKWQISNVKFATGLLSMYLLWKPICSMFMKVKREKRMNTLFMKARGCILVNIVIRNLNYLNLLENIYIVITKMNPASSMTKSHTFFLLGFYHHKFESLLGCEKKRGGLGRWGVGGGWVGDWSDLLKDTGGLDTVRVGVCQNSSTWVLREARPTGDLQRPIEAYRGL